MSILVLLTGLFLLWVSQFWPVKGLDESFAGRVARLDREGRAWAERRGWGKPAPAPAVTLIAINDASVASHPWPWTPLDFSLFLQAITPFQPDVIAIDEVLDWDRAELSPGDRMKLPQYTKILHDALLRTPRVLLASELGWPEDPFNIPAIGEAPILKKVKGDLRAVPDWTVVEHDPKEEYRLSSTVGYVNLRDQGRPLASTPLLLRYQGRVVPTLVLQAILLWQKLSPDDVSVVLGSHLQVGEKLRIPIDERGEMRVHFGAPVLRAGFDELLLATEQVAAKQKPVFATDRVAHAIALLARTDQAAAHVRFHTGEQGTRGELFAEAIATIQAGSFLWPAPIWLSGGLIGLAAALAFGVPRWRKSRVALWALLALLAYLVAAVALFSLRHWLLPVALPLGLALFIALYRLATPNSVWKLGRPVIL